MSSSNDPLTIPFDKLVDLIRSLGLDPVDPKDINRITVDAYGVEVVRFRRTESGALLLGFGESPLTETVTVRLEL